MTPRRLIGPAEQIWSDIRAVRPSDMLAEARSQLSDMRPDALSFLRSLRVLLGQAASRVRDGSTRLHLTEWRDEVVRDADAARRGMLARAGAVSRQAWSWWRSEASPDAGAALRQAFGRLRGECARFEAELRLAVSHLNGARLRAAGPCRTRARAIGLAMVRWLRHGAAAVAGWVTLAWGRRVEWARGANQAGTEAAGLGAGDGLGRVAGGRGRVAAARGGGFRPRVPDLVRITVAGAAVLAVVLGIGFRLGQPGTGTVERVQGSPSAAPLVPAAPPQAVIAPETGERVVPLAWLNPIVGPHKPPLPADVDGPHGSRRTTGTYEVALTFDDGPDPRFTPVVLKLLREHRVKATFCVIGVNVVEFPELVQAIDAEGHTLCNHSWGHDTSLGNRSRLTVVSDMVRTNEAIRAAAPNARVSYFRHPGGAWTPTAVETARQLGMTSLHWNVDPRDWLRPGARAISSMVNSAAVPGSIVLLHDGGGDRRGTVDALDSILANLTARFPMVALPPGSDPPRRFGLDRPVHWGQQ